MRVRIKGKFVKIPDGYMSVQDHEMQMQLRETKFKHDENVTRSWMHKEIDKFHDEGFKSGLVVGVIFTSLVSTLLFLLTL